MRAEKEERLQERADELGISVDELREQFSEKKGHRRGHFHRQGFGDDRMNEVDVDNTAAEI